MIRVQTESGSLYDFREYSNGKWEMKRDADSGSGSLERAVKGHDGWVKLLILPHIIEGRPMVIYPQGSDPITTSKVQIRADG
jgi:hypothetical protein